MEINPKAMARTKHMASRRGRPRPARGRGGPKNAHNISTNANKSAQVIEASEEDRDSEEEENKGKSRGLDYAELLSQQPISYYGQLPGLPDMSSISLARGVDNLGWGFDDIYDGNVGVGDTAASDAAAMLSLNLEILGRELGKLPLHELLMVDDNDTLLKDMLRQEVSSSSPSRVSPDSSGAYEEKSMQMVYDEKTVQVVNADISNKQGRLDATNLHQTSGAVNEEHWDFGSSSEIIDATNLHQSSGIVNKEHLSWDFGSSSEVIQGGKKELEIQKMNISSSLASFQPAAAEAELDALLDMLDSVQLNENSITVPSETSSSLPGFMLATNKGQEHDSLGKQTVQWLETGPVEQDPKLPVLSDDLQENFDAWFDSL